MKERLGILESSALEVERRLLAKSHGPRGRVLLSPPNHGLAVLPPLDP